MKSPSEFTKKALFFVLGVESITVLSFPWKNGEQGQRISQVRNTKGSLAWPHTEVLCKDFLSGDFMAKSFRVFVLICLCWGRAYRTPFICSGQSRWV